MKYRIGMTRKEWLPELHRRRDEVAARKKQVQSMIDHARKYLGEEKAKASMPTHMAWIDDAIKSYAHAQVIYRSI